MKLTQRLGAGMIGALALTATTSVTAQQVTFVPSASIFNPGESGTIDVFVSADILVNQGFSIDILSSLPGSVAFSDFTILNPTVDSTSFPGQGLGGPRWQGTGIDSIGSDEIANARGFAVTEGTGLDPENTGSTAPFFLLDEAYDAGLNAFLFGTATFDAVSEGTSTISGNAGEFGIGTDGNEISSQFSFGTTSIEVVPEPASLALFGLGGVMLVGRRRNRA